MKGVLALMVYLFVLLGLNGCYTILPTSEVSNEVTEVVVYYPVPVPIPPPDPGPWPHPDPPYPPSPRPPAPYPELQPKLRQPEVPTDRKGFEDQVRDPLRGHAERRNGEGIPDPVNKPNRNDGGRR